MDMVQHKYTQIISQRSVKTSGVTMFNLNIVDINISSTEWLDQGSGTTKTWRPPQTKKPGCNCRGKEKLKYAMKILEW